MGRADRRLGRPPPFFGTVPGTRIHYGAGYSGNGVGPSWLGGQILARLAAGRRGRADGACRSSTAACRPLPPEPIKRVGGGLVRAASLAVEEAEEEGRRRRTRPAPARAAPSARAAGRHALMEIVLGMFRPRDPGGTEHYTLVVAEHLQRLGHQVTIFTEETGPMAELARSRGLRLTKREDELPAEADVVYAQESITAYRLGARYRKAPLVVAVHAVDYDLSVPPQLPELVSAVVVTHERAARRARAFAVAAELVRLRQPVDVSRLTPRASLREPPRRLLALGNYLQGDRARVIDDACAGLGIEVVHVGAHGGGGRCWSPRACSTTRTSWSARRG